MVLLRGLMVLPVAIALSGCGAALERWESGNSFMVSAEDLAVTNDDIASVGNNNKTFIGLVLNDSEQKCGRFVNGLVLASNSTNVGLDMATTVFTALGTAFTPVATIHALTAAGSISSGWKTAIDADIYAKATIANYAQAVQATYYTDLGKYTVDLTLMDDRQVTASIEVAKIRTIHKECSLAAAQASIAATLQSSPQPGGGGGGGGGGGPAAGAPVAPGGRAPVTTGTVPGSKIKNQ
jgi:hypothetical protein